MMGVDPESGAGATIPGAPVSCDSLQGSRSGGMWGSLGGALLVDVLQSYGSDYSWAWREYAWRAY